MRKRPERGFALLLVFAMAAVVAVTLYLELPSAVFEAQRLKEQLLIERGEEYKRAIQLYVRKHKNYPPSLDALENTNNIRFLRRRYDDPMTGKKEWRLIHIAGGVFTDSLVYKQQQSKEKKLANTFITEGPAFGATAPQPGTGGPSVWMRARRRMVGTGTPGTAEGSETGTPPEEASRSSETDTPPAMAPVDSGNQPPAAQSESATPVQGQAMPGAGGMGSGGFGAQQPGGSNPATRMIMESLTRPRPGGLAGPGAAMGSGQMGSGIAGVATTLEASGIKVYNERTKYNEWEFIYDQSKDRTGLRAATGGMQAPQQGQGSGSTGGRGSFSGSFSGGSFRAPNPQSGYGQSGVGQIPGFGGFGRPATPAVSQPGGTGQSGSGGFGAGFGSGFGSGFGTTTPAPSTPPPAAKQPAAPKPPTQQQAPTQQQPGTPSPQPSQPPQN